MKDEEMLERVQMSLLAMQRYSWEQGVTAQAFLEQGNMPLTIALSREAANRALPDGRAAVIGHGGAATDPCSVGEALLVSARATGDKKMSDAYDALLEWALHKAPRNANGVVYHFESTRQFWSDSMYMLPPFLAAADHPDEALINIYGYWEALFDPTQNLMRHMWDDEKQFFVRSAHWGVGNGWTLAGLARVIPLLPESLDSDRKNLASMATQLLDGVTSHMRSDGLFHDIVDDPASFVETNLSQMVAYTIYRGVKDGWLDRTRLPIADKARRAARGKVDEWGLVQDVCAAPTFDRPGVAPEGQAFFLLMEAAANRV
jgi:rhamnogalacturonyl hydrolase YesR